MPEYQAQQTTILIVDDNRDNLILISLSVQGYGHRVVTATSGVEAIKTALLARPDLILMDIAMPEMDGLTAARHIRRHPELQHIPIVALTAFDTGGFQRAAADAGFDAYLTKPIDFDRLNRLIEVFLRDVETTDLSLETKELTTELSSETKELKQEHAA